MSTELVKREETALAVAEPLPAFLQHRAGEARGAEGIESNDVKLPQLRICQSMTPQRKRNDPKYIPGLEENQMFNDLTNVIYGEGPLQFTVIRFLGKKGIQFDPNTPGVVLDFDVPLNDARMEFTTDPETGQRVKPIATLYYDYLILLIHPDGTLEPIVLSMKGTQIKIAKQLNSLIKLARVDTFAALYEIRVVNQTKDQYTFGNFKIERVRTEGKPAWVTEAAYRASESLYAQFEGKNIVIDREPEEREPGVDEDVPY
jgi:hypothetical protein